MNREEKILAHKKYMWNSYNRIDVSNKINELNILYREIIKDVKINMKEFILCTNQFEDQENWNRYFFIEIKHKNGNLEDHKIHIEPIDSLTEAIFTTMLYTDEIYFNYDNDKEDTIEAIKFIIENVIEIKLTKITKEKYEEVE